MRSGANTREPNPTPFNLHKCFFMAARLTLNAQELARVAWWMRDMGASVDADALLQDFTRPNAAGGP
jgi:hypothetical protein